MSNNKKYVSIGKLQTFLDNLKSVFASISHKHNMADIADYAVDTELSHTSNNPVSNSVLDAEFDAISNAMAALETAIDNKVESWNDLADKPFYNEQVVIDWDGNVDGRDTFTLALSDTAHYNYYKLSDNVPTIDDLIGGTTTFNGETLALINGFLVPDVGCYYIGEPAFVVVQNTVASMYGLTITPPSTGIYFINMDGAYVSNLTYDSIKTLDETFIPDTIARKSDISTVGSNWSLIYDSGEITEAVNAISDIDISSYKDIQIVVQNVNDGTNTTNAAGAVIFTSLNGCRYLFNTWQNLFSTSSGKNTCGIAHFKLLNGWLMLEHSAYTPSSTNDIFSNTEGGTATKCSAFSGGALMKCTNELSTLAVTSSTQSASNYFGVGSRIIVWGV